MADKKGTLVLLDAHAVLHRAFHALPDFTSPQGEPTGALYGFTSTLLKTIKELKPDYLAACYDLPEPTFRHQIYENYKAKRPKTSDELVLQIENSKRILKAFNIPIYEKSGFEADDILASIVQQLKPISNLKIIIVTGDLDTLQLVRDGVEVYTMRKGIQDVVVYDERAVKKRFGFSPGLLPDFKGLMGDPSDNIIGVPGIGEKTAKILIQNLGSLEEIYKKFKKDKKSFAKIGIKPRIIKILEENEEEAFFSKALAVTRKDVPISFSLADSKWTDGLEKEKVKSLFLKFGFKSLLKRLSSDEDSAKSLFGEGLGGAEVKVAFWLLDSRRINPSIQDILDTTRTSSLKEAKEVLEKDIKKSDFAKLFYEVELPLVNVLSRMERNGVLLDIDYLKSLSADYHKRLNVLENKIWALAGEKFNINSPKQLSEMLFEKMGISTKGVRRTVQGVFSTRFSELEKIKDRHKIVEEIFSYRELAKLTSTYIDNLPNLTREDGRLHTSFNQTGTTTGRLSSSDPNLQNIPTRTDFGHAVRRAFIVPKGWRLISFDYSQIELRVAASLSGDEKLKETFLKGEDIHTKVAAEVFNVPFENVNSEMRRKAKVINFGIIYGMGINSLRKNLNCSREEAEVFYGEYFNDFSGMADYMEKVKKDARETGFTRTLFNRRRYLPEINSSLVFIRKEAERMAINAPIQGTAADIIKMAMVSIDKALSEKEFLGKTKMLLQVHDELLFEIKDAVIENAKLVIKKTMESVGLPGVPLVVEGRAGLNWADLQQEIC
jgi:DNA polymerase-1